MDSRLSPRAIVKAVGEVPICRAGDAIRVLARSPIGHCRVPTREDKDTNTPKEAGCGNDYPHPHAAISRSVPAGYYEIMETAVRELLVERKLIGTEEIRRQIEVLAGQPQLRFLVIATGTDGKLGRVVQRQVP